MADSRIGPKYIFSLLYLYVYDSLYRRYPIPPFFASPESGGIGRDDCMRLRSGRRLTGDEYSHVGSFTLSDTEAMEKTKYRTKQKWQQKVLLLL